MPEGAGRDAQREGLAKTPERVSGAKYLTSGYDMKVEDVLTTRSSSKIR